MLRRSLVLFIVVVAVIPAPRAQMRVVPLDEEGGHLRLGLALRHLGNTATLLHTTAHPDDENNGLLVMLNRGQGYRTALATATRGNGGQNEIGPELNEALGVLRTKELEALHRFDGAEQYFTRAVDFGYSFSVEDTFQKWGRDEITADYVRLMRMIRPDVVIALMPTGNDGGQHHQASAVITRDAFKAAGDPEKYADQLKDGLRPWQPKKMYFLTGFGLPGESVPPGPLARINLDVYDPLLGKTYAEIGSEARSMHKCQGMGQLLALPGPYVTTYQLAESTLGTPPRDETSLFEGIDSSILGLAKFAGARAPKSLIEGLTRITATVLTAQKDFATISDQATVKPLLDGLFAVRVLRQELRAMPIDASARFEIDFRLRQKEREFQQAALFANAVTLDAQADDGVVVPGQTVKVSLIAATHGAADVAVKDVRFEGFVKDPGCSFTAPIKKDQTVRCEQSVTIPPDARVAEPYWHRAGEAGRYTFDPDAPFGLPFRPTTFYVTATLTFAGTEEVFDTVPVRHRYEGNVFSGEKMTELLIVPPLSVRVSPPIAIVPETQPVPTMTTARGTTPATGRGGRGGAGRGAVGSTGAATRGTARGAAARSAASPATSAVPPPSAVMREVRVTVVNDMPSAADALVRLDAPDGWNVAPLEQRLAFTRSDESRTIRFEVTPPTNSSVADVPIRATATLGEQTIDRGYEVIEYPHITRYHTYDPAVTMMKVLNVRTPEHLTVGYVKGTGDQVPAALEQIGARVELIGPDDLGWGDLSRFSAIVTGVRAYERREDLRANNGRLLEYVFNGGTMIVQYNKFEFNEAQYGPYPAKISAARVTDAHSAVRILDPHSSILTTPNEIGDAAWQNWVQERGLYFLGEKDSRYHDVVELQDAFPGNSGPKTGALVEARYGKGRWVYVGLSLWRQLPAGVDGAYQLLANLISAGTAPR